MKKEAFCFGDSEISRKGQTAEVEAVDTSWGGEGENRFLVTIDGTCGAGHS